MNIKVAAFTVSEKSINIQLQNVHCGRTYERTVEILDRAVILFLLVHCLLLLPLCGGCVWSLFDVVLCVLSILAIISLLNTSPEVIKPFFMLNSTEHEISTAHKN